MIVVSSELKEIIDEDVCNVVFAVLVCLIFFEC